MEDIFNNLLLGCQVAFQPINILWVTFGGILGSIIGLLPGVGPATGVALLLPLTYTMGPASALITMCGIYYGAMYGGAGASILINTPGDGASIATCFDGYPLAMKGRAEAALAMAGISSFIAGIISTFFLIFLAKPVSALALKFGPAEYFLLMLAALSMTAALNKGNALRGFIAVLLGLMVSTIGLDAQSGVKRFTFGLMDLQSGVEFLTVIIAIYALGEVFESVNEITQGTKTMQTKFKRIWITRDDWNRSWIPILRSTPLGFLMGAIPGCGGTMSALVAYNCEKQWSKNPEEWGQGEIAGVAVPEGVNNAASVGALIPMLTFGIPGSGTTAVMLGAFLMLGLQPGPLLFSQHPEIAWGIIASMFIGNIILAFVNIPMAGFLVRILAAPPKILYPCILVLAFIGTYAVTNSIADFYILIVFSIVGYLMKMVKIPTAPMILALIVGNSMEISFRQALVISNGNFQVFMSSPLSIMMIVTALAFMTMPLWRKIFNNRNKAMALG
jgi:putative tricarboxylic transport membrane protein